MSPYLLNAPDVESRACKGTTIIPYLSVSRLTGIYEEKGRVFGARCAWVSVPLKRTLR